jgi:hypothetical protein
MKKGSQNFGCPFCVSVPDFCPPYWSAMAVFNGHVTMKEFANFERHARDWRCAFGRDQFGLGELLSLLTLGPV